MSAEDQNPDFKESLGLIIDSLDNIAHALTLVLPGDGVTIKTIDNG